MTYSIERLADDVLALLGENARSPSVSLATGDVPSVRSRIERRIAALLPEIGSEQIAGAPVTVLGGGEPLTAEVEFRRLPCGLYGADVGLPDDVVRVAAVKMASWERAVSEPIPASSGESGREWSKEPGIAGNPIRPHAYLSIGERGRKLTLCGSETEADRLEICLVWRIPGADGEGKFRYPEILVPALAARIAEAITSRTS